jgi:hypothetical protein
MAAGMCGWSCLRGWMGTGAGSAVVGMPPGRQRWRCWPGCGRRGRGCRCAGADGGGLAGALAGIPHHPGQFDVARLYRACAAVPGPVSGGRAAGRADHRAGAGNDRRDHPPPPCPGHPDLRRDADPDPGDAAGRAERGDPPRPAGREPGQPSRVAQSPPSQGGGYGRRTGSRPGGAPGNVPRWRCGLRPRPRSS